jgi:hypothetical protein
MSAVSSKVRLYDLAKSLKVDTKRLIAEVRREGLRKCALEPHLEELADRIRIHSLGPNETYVGIAEFEGYVVSCFSRAATAVLDCPVMGNAIYVFGENWKYLSRLTKSDLLNGRRRDFDRIIHNGEWFLRLKSLVSTRESRANLRRQQKVSQPNPKGM